MINPAAELRKELLQGLDYYGVWETDAAHEEEVERQRFIRNEVENDGAYADLAWNGKLIALGKLVAAEHAHGWLELHVLPKLNAAIPEDVPEDGVTISISREGAESFVSDSAGWGAIGLQEITEAIHAELSKGEKP